MVTSYADIAPQVTSGQAKLLDTLPQLGVKGGAGFITRPDVLDNPAEVAALKDFFSRFTKLYSQWYPSHEAAVEQIYETVDHQSPSVPRSLMRPPRRPGSTRSATRPSCRTSS